MIKCKELQTLTDFEKLNQGDWVAVEFAKPTTYWIPKNSTFKPQEFTNHIFQIYDVKLRDQEVILQKNGNIYFSYKQFLYEHKNFIKSVALIEFTKESQEEQS